MNKEHYINNKGVKGKLSVKRIRNHNEYKSKGVQTKISNHKHCGRKSIGGDSRR